MSVVLSKYPKEAALYFDSVIPIAAHADILKSAIESGRLSANLGDAIKFIKSDIGTIFQEEGPVGAFDRKYLNKIAPNISDEMVQQIEFLSASFLFRYVMIEMGGRIEAGEKAYIGFSQSLKMADTFYDNLDIFMDKWKLNEAVFDFIPKGSGGPHDLCLELMATKLIDVTHVGWDQILELRKDSDSRHALLNFRKMVAEDFEDWSIEQISEELELREYDYIAASKKHGFALFDYTVKTLLSSRAVGGGSFISMVSMAFGGGALSALPVAVPIVAELGKSIIKIRSHQHETAQIRAQHPVSYLERVRSKL